MLQHRSPQLQRRMGPVFGSYCQKKQTDTASDLSRQLSSATGTTVSKADRWLYRRLGHVVYNKACQIVFTYRNSLSPAIGLSQCEHGNLSDTATVV
ncbi:hypothetical protein AVEN_160249-1 [Araneus ventricosus]|uniref:Uncharacterized protein n=1 Tax=Araneus ventricosus TaxID=182803 RepID=A0A4Y2UGW8_ARAVE|nr:hypothetical protein AVEN_160249-1 [Araneus ventricosus]